VEGFVKPPWTVRLPWLRYFVAGEVAAADLVPERIPRRAVFVVRCSGKQAWLALDCPCSRRHRLLINLDPDRRPSWRMDTGRHLSLSPSVDVLDSGRRCHFSIRNGRVQWVSRR